MDTQFLTAEVARRHGMLLDRGDPIFIGLTLNELVLTEFLEKGKAAIEAAQDQASIGAEQQVESAKHIAERLVTGAGAYVTAQMKTAGKTIGEGLCEIVRVEIENAREAARQAAAARRAARRAALLALSSSLLTMGAGVWLLWMKTR